MGRLEVRSSFVGPLATGRANFGLMSRQRTADTKDNGMSYPVKTLTENRRGSFVLPLVALIVILAFPAEAQIAASFAQLNGTLFDPSGSRTSKARVVLHGLDTNQTYAAHPNADGFYVLSNVASLGNRRPLSLAGRKPAS
jgi:hypothetical protein